MRLLRCALPALLLAGCTDPSEPEPVPVGVCGAVVREFPLEAGIHHEPGTALTWHSNPPVTGPHFVIWARWGRTYLEPPMPRGYWLHNAEHGGVVLLVNCPAGCADDVARLEALAASLPVDDRCVAPIRNRIVVTADPLLPAEVRVAAVAWGVSYTATCVDETTLRPFITGHYGQAPENLCADSTYPPLP